MNIKALVVTVVAMALGATLLAQDQARERKLQQAIDLLETKGDAARAMPLLEDVAKSADQSLAARGLLYLGQAQERQGNARARATYERIIRDFAPQQQIVAQARERIAALGRVSVSAGATVHRVLWTLPDKAYAYGPVSRDGRHILHSDSKGDFLLHDLADGSDTIVLRSQGAMAPEWATLSRDAKQVAYIVPETVAGGPSYALYVGAVGTGSVMAPRRVFVERGLGWLEPHDWSVDGRWIAAALYPVGQPRSDEIALISVVDGSKRILKKGARLNPTTLAFSPDGRYLASDSFAGDARDVSIISLNAGSESVVAPHRAEDRLVGWAPDGKAVLFTSDRTGTDTLWQQQVDVSGQGKPEILKTDIGYLLPLGVSRDGAVLSSSTAGQAPMSDVKVGTFNFASGEWVAAPRDAVEEYLTGSASHPDLSPDGKRLAYVTTRGGRTRADRAIAIRALDTGTSQELRVGLDSISGVRWTPDGDSLAVRGTRDGRPGIWRMGVNSPDLTSVVTGDESTVLVITGWSPDGRRFYFRESSTRGNWSLNVMDWPSGGNRSELIRTAGTAGYPLPSPDGRKVYYSRALGGQSPYAQFAFIERDVTTGAEKELIRRNLGGVNLSPDGRFIATGSNDQSTGTRSILLLPTAGGATRVLMNSPGTQGLSVYAWAPDSASVVIRKGPMGGKPAELWWVPIANPSNARLMLTDEAPSVDEGGGMRASASGRITYLTSTTPSSSPRQVWILENVLRPPAIKK